jgi:MOSC domain-containing protein YiiM
MQGAIVQVNVSTGGVPKRAIPSAQATPLGLAGDAHAHPHIHGGPRQALLLIAVEVIEELAREGFPVYPGALGENLTVRGFDFRQLRPGHRFRAGAALIELTKVRAPCKTLDVYGPAIKDAIYDARVKAGDPSSEKWGRSGFYAAVVEPGPIATGDAIRLVDAAV